jgi:hypothetical protein
MADNPYRPPTADIGALPADAARIEVGETLRLSARSYGKALALVLLFGAITGGLNAVPGVLMPASGDPQADLLTSAVQIGAGLTVGMLIGPFTASAYAWTAQQVARGEAAPVGAALRHAASRYGRVFVVNLAYTLAVTLGTMACFIPGVALSVLMGPMLMSAVLSPAGTSDWNAGWAVGKAHFWPLLVAMILSWLPTMLISGVIGGAAGAFAVTGQTLPGWVSVAGGVGAGLVAPVVSTTLASAWLLAARRSA